MARGKLPSVHTATEQVQWGQASKKGAWEQGENKRHLEDQNRSLPVWSQVIQLRRQDEDLKNWQETLMGEQAEKVLSSEWIQIL